MSTMEKIRLIARAPCVCIVFVQGVKMLTLSSMGKLIVECNLKKLRTSEGDYWINQLFPSIRPLFKMATSFAPRWGQFLIVWEITFTLLGDFP